MKMTEAAGQGEVLYFGYASNLLREKLALRSPSAKLVSIGKVQGYRLIFESHAESGKWHGAMATMDQSRDDHIWGAVYTMDEQDVDAMDREEGAAGGVSRRLDLEVETPGGEKMKSYAYYFDGRDSDERRPSPQYLGLIIKGAEELGLPTYYQERLRAVEHNGYRGEVEMLTEMEHARPGN